MDRGTDRDPGTAYRCSEQATSDLAFIAAQRALEDAGIRAEDLDLIVVGTESPDMKFPSVACILQDKLGAAHAAAFDLAAGCSGFVYACGIASQTIFSGLYKHVLVVGAETLSRILNWQVIGTICILFRGWPVPLYWDRWKKAVVSCPSTWEPMEPEASI